MKKPPLTDSYKITDLFHTCINPKSLSKSYFIFTTFNVSYDSNS